jgi:hypothetical protein
MLLICVDVAARAVANHPIRGVSEIVGMSLVACVFLQLPHILASGRLKGRRVGIVSNPASVDASLQHIVDHVAALQVARAGGADRIECEGGQAVLRVVWRAGLHAVHFPEEYGGSGDEVTFAIATEEIARACAGISVVYLVSLGLGMYPIVMHGNEKQKRHYIPRVIDGAIVAFGLTEAMAGSDVAAMETKYARQGDHYVLNGQKIFISNGAEAEIVTTFATKDKSLGYRGISAFVVDKGTKGFSVGKLERKWGWDCHGLPIEVIVEDELGIKSKKDIEEKYVDSRGREERHEH